MADAMVASSAASMGQVDEWGGRMAVRPGGGLVDGVDVERAAKAEGKTGEQVGAKAGKRVVGEVALGG